MTHIYVIYVRETNLKIDEIPSLPTNLYVSGCEQVYKKGKRVIDGSNNIDQSTIGMILLLF